MSVAERMCAHIDASPTPFHAVAHAVSLVEAAGGAVVDERDAWPAGPGLHAVARGGALVAWRTDGHHRAGSGFRVIGAHTDSPNLRVKPNADRSSAGFRQLGVDVYGGALLNSWLDRDLGLSGRLTIRDGDRGVRDVLVRVDRPVLRVPQLAIHLDREINEKGLLLNRQSHLSPVWGLGGRQTDLILDVVSEGQEHDPSDIVSWDLMLHDLQPATIAGLDDEFLSAPRIDNLLSCFLAVEALAAVSPGPRIPVVCLFDHEEVGSVSARGAASPLLGRVLERITAAAGGTTDDQHRAVADSVVLSADGAHATHPNYAERHEPDHQIALNAGPVLKVNSNQRYATDAESAAVFVLACEDAGVPHQTFVNRSDLACGSTIGPITAGRLGMAVVDAGCAQLAMHSIRELAGSHDPAWFRAVMESFLVG